MAWWGSFRIGEIIPKSSSRFNSKKDLLASDLTFLGDSVACWIHAPKVPKSPQGDVVEVWKVPIRPDLDPVVALVAFLSARSEKFGSAEALPVFLHENGKIYSKNEFNLDLSTLLAVYPELDTKRDKWSGHSFRSGLSTLLSLLNFSKVEILIFKKYFPKKFKIQEEIKSWGRWASDSYQR